MSAQIWIDDGWAELYVREDGSVLLETNTTSGAGLRERRYDFPAGSAPLIASIFGVAPDGLRQYLVTQILAQGGAHSLLDRMAAGGLSPAYSQDYFN